MATDEEVAQIDSTWDEFSSALTYRRCDIYECNGSNVNLDFPSVAVLFNQWCTKEIYLTK